MVFVETPPNGSTRTTYSVALNRLSIVTERSVREDGWKSVFVGSYRRPRG
jgi:hypothetical protein